MFNRAVVVGVGLLGASLGLALRTKGLCRRVTGVGRNRETLVKAREQGAVDDFEIRLEAALPADLVVLATPAAAVPGYLGILRQHDAGDGRALITDVASTKAAICAEAARLWPENRPFVGAHPMAGGEKWGPEWADANLYRDAVCFLERAGGGMSLVAQDWVRALWEAVGCRVVDIDPQVHDHVLSRTSHLPHVAAAALAMVAAAAGADSRFIGNGFRDATRIAAGRAEIWRDICLTNREEILSALGEYRDALDAFIEAVRTGNGEHLETLFDRARIARREVTGT